MHTQNQSSVGPYAGLLIIIVVMLIGAVYFINTTKNTIQEKELSADEIRQAIDPQTESLKSLGTSDEIESIADDANLTDTENLLPELNLIEKQL